MINSRNLIYTNILDLTYKPMISVSKYGQLALMLFNNLSFI